MADETSGRNEIKLNGIRHKIKGSVRPRLASVMPGKIVIGDYSNDTEPVASIWAVDDQRGGIGVEEMDERVHNDRCWGSTCDLRFKGSIVLPPLATPITLDVYPGEVADGGFEIWTDASTLTNWTKSSTGTLSRDGTNQRSGTYCAKAAMTAGQSVILSQTLTWNNNYRGKVINVSIWGKHTVWASGVSNFKVSIYDGVATTDGTAVTTSTSYQQATAVRTLDAAATGLTITVTATAVDGATHVLDDYRCDAPYTGSPKKMVNYNSNLYLASGRNLWKLNAAGNGFTLIDSFKARITDLVVSEANSLYILLGDDDFYYYMDTAEIFTETSQADATLGVHWDNLLGIMDSAGLIQTCVDPSNAIPTFAAKGSLANLGVADGTIHSLFTSRDADGTMIIYAAGEAGLWAHDYANAKWIETELVLPDHPNGGKGVVRWRDGLYISSGLDAMKYTAARTATITSVGLAKDDGLLAEYAGEIVKFTGGFNELFALVDASQVIGTGYSTVMSYDGGSWQCKWVDSNADKVMNCALVSSAVARRLWFDVDGGMQWIALDRNLRNPKKISTHDYGTAGIHITPWFDAGWSGDKLALSFFTECDDMSANETIVVKYRINHVNTDRDTGWTTLDTVIADGEDETIFGSNLGLVFRSIQFRFDLARGATTTSSPILRKFALRYLKRPEVAWGYLVDIDCTDEFGNKDTATLLDAIRTVVDTATLVEFYYNDTVHYCFIKSIGGDEQTGKYESGTYSVFLVEP